MDTSTIGPERHSAFPPHSTQVPDAMLCEVAWEVCQQVGGIYTVIRSKVPVMMETWGPRYLLIGPYEPGASPAEFEELPPEGLFGQAAQRMREWGYHGVHYGRWLITGQPRVVLLDYRTVFGRLGDIKYQLWEHHDIGTPASDPLIDGVVAFGHMVEKFLRALLSVQGLDRPVIAHFHEWMGGSAIPELRRANLPLSIVFMTHATMLGRYLAMNDPWFYDHLPFLDWAKEAQHFNVEPQVKIERAAAHGAHLFATLSEITGYECQFLVGRRPDILLPNGLNIERFVAMHEFQNLHRHFKERIHQFVIGHFFPSYTFDLDHTLYFFTSGRYEFRNKGFDATIDALAQLNWRMKAANIDRTVVFFLTTRRPTRSINAEALQSRGVMEEIRKSCEAIKEQLGQRLFMSTVMNQSPKMDDLVEDYWKLRLRRMRQSWRISRFPSIVTHDLWDDVNDDVLNRLRAHNLINRPDDKVKVVYTPDFITSSNPLFGMEYNQFVRGCHMGVFPSYYEPWGYTPEECMALGVPAITSDLTGFGTYLLRSMPDHASRGLYIVHRRMHSYESAVNEMTDYMFNFLQLERRDRIGLRNRVESSSDAFDWHSLIHHYWAGYREVCQRTGVAGQCAPHLGDGPQASGDTGQEIPPSVAAQQTTPSEAAQHAVQATRRREGGSGEQVEDQPAEAMTPPAPHGAQPPNTEPPPVNPDLATEAERETMPAVNPPSPS